MFGSREAAHRLANAAHFLLLHAFLPRFGPAALGCARASFRLKRSHSVLAQNKLV